MKTDNSFFAEKIDLRIDAIKDIEDPFILDCFAGKGLIWDEVQKQTGKNIKVTGIEKEPGKNNLALVGDNRKYLKSMDLSVFDVIDLDAYGYPVDQLELIFKRKYKGIVIITAIQSMMGMLPKKMLYEIGYNKEMVDKIPAIFNRKGIDKLKKYLYLHQCQIIKGYFIDRKNYFYINLKSKAK